MWIWELGGSRGIGLVLLALTRGFIFSSSIAFEEVSKSTIAIPLKSYIWSPSSSLRRQSLPPRGATQKYSYCMFDSHKALLVVYSIMEIISINTSIPITLIIILLLLGLFSSTFLLSLLSLTFTLLFLLLSLLILVPFS